MSSPAPINWKRNLTVAWVGCFLTGAAFSLVMPFLPLYVELLGVTGHSALNMWSGLVFSITFLFSAMASPFWGGLADRKGRKIMLLRSALGMAIVMALMGFAQNIWQFLVLRALLGLLGGFIPNANALIATQMPRNRSGWAMGTLSTGGVAGALLGPLAGGLLADVYGLRMVFFITASVLFICFLLTLFCIRENFTPVAKKEMLHAKEVLASLKSPRLVLSLFVTTMIIQVATGSIAPILTLYVRELAGNVGNIAFISGMIASVPGVAALMSAPRLGRLGDRIGPEKILVAALLISVLLLVPMAFVQTPWQLGLLRFLLGAADGALLPAVQTLLVYNTTQQIAGRVFSYNQSFRDIGNVTGPLLGAAVSANYSFRAVFCVTAGIVLFNAFYSWVSLQRPARQRVADRVIDD
ncbi:MULTISPECIES: multidrug efflux MFS transporter MdtG [Enterobacteriaceae]|jgi:DHA1 family multidrug resistance protein-like MFS transporter|uniref:Multidrug resistance protein MdtG n=3 Tax=Enterobacteriaceae TaxID=543 RepID=A0ABW1Q0F7_9ENTR|nr:MULTISPECIES: multidrug efflux MFS transporter MdtG [Phytobacter]AUU91658.1 multidrug transporter MdtG [Enterobacteriaceae bacterium ENNIH3]AUV08324.1 multidrug transporter MdtG [Enterobacteriaceae bacterium ENNIH2]MBS6737018.1 multidrug efflux MFS transporter MdtG [Enterobacteriaceae bacterium]PTA96879.1 multidrug transporter MdtG [Kluyvera sp. Nf5]PWF49937.1 multidrug transporter MdtG [[Kluyvera] intestini]QIH62932.1 multidrug transporter MdtG [Enterobacteriaceae bacterium A-F18]SLJ9112